ncbi:MAG: hypothetical protein IJF71_05365 [Clostridia bacterium]|nr:hypothetical protein [Clostridia bacterium]
MNRRLRIAAAVLLVAVLLQCTGCMLWGGGFRAFENRTYVQYEQSELDGLLREAELLSEDEANAGALLKQYKKIVEAYWHTVNALQLSELYLDLDVSNEELAEKYIANAQLYDYFYNEVKKTEKILVTSPAKEKLVEYMGEEYVAEVLSEVVLSDAQLQLKAEESRLTAQYATLYQAGDRNGARALYPRLVSLRKKIAKAFGFDSYADYAYLGYGRAYTPEEAELLVDYVAKYLSPVWEGALAAKPTEIYSYYLSEKSLLSEAYRVILELGGKSLSESFTYMKRYGLYDVSPSETKSEGAFVKGLSYYGDAFLFINPSESLVDLTTLVHEYGHYNYMMCGMGSGALDLLETHSQGLEILALDAYPSVLGEKEARAVSAYTVMSGAWTVLSNLMFEAFEEYAFSLPEEVLLSDEAVALLEQEYTRLTAEFGLNTSVGMGNMQYVDIPHIYSSPFYCISYTVSFLSAAQFGWMDFEGMSAVDAYQELIFSSSTDYMEAIAEVGLLSPFEEQTVYSTALFMAEELQALGVAVTVPEMQAAA